MDEEPDIPNLESIPQHIAEKLLQLGKLVPRQKLNAVSKHIKGTAALRASLPMICEFDTLRNR
ncbi:hypothetical protein TVAG_146290 [Trichomonas vaginalis G3]|uniref:Uncharacterized protein n=1 Tax=Trichomonas vaginalis (strain ATCC PRA-98 / G3) TaxID=412133 RepID=A2FRD2_TRIV3|nr:MULE transposase domain-containing protein [Trichomonas vaginalis G3]EAX92533.1 hypothetical protein TVAG_146290 [Trichomonas vaginalis G3]KAI5494249.1 MULE transposase domain-containing protein [Trichomonas vaginalis G3]|eukprot:XP_001305463.1 hypothetical protein [Trichomonas vaginalis G3]